MRAAIFAGGKGEKGEKEEEVPQDQACHHEKEISISSAATATRKRKSSQLVPVPAHKTLSAALRVFF